MKKVIFLSILFLICCSSILLFNSKSDISENESDNLQAEEFYFCQRNWPDAPDMKGYMQSMDDVKLKLSNQTSRSATNWSVEGPTNIGGRINCMAVSKTNSQLIYAGMPQGGVFKTTDGGINWNPVFDSQNYLSIGAITIDPLDNQIVYVGTGDLNISGYPGIGDGVYKTTDGGQSWSHVGLTNECIISKILIDPSNTNTVYASAMGIPFERTADRGLYKSVDGGTTWTQILFVDSDAGIIDMVMDPVNPGTLYSASWNRIRNNHESVLYGPDAHIYKTTDGGNSWNILSNGLPNENTCRIGLAISQQDHNKLYAIIIDTVAFNAKGIYKTTTGGSSWNNITNNFDQNAFGTQGWYHGKIYVNPSNDNQIYIPGVDMQKSFDGGNSYSSATPPWWTYQVHADGHYLEFVNANTMYYCTDGGMYKTTDNTINWSDAENMPISQFYHIAMSTFQNDEFFGGAQDNGTTGGNNLFINNWPRIYGGDGFQPWYDNTTNGIQYAETQNGGLAYSDDGGSNWFGFTNGINSTDRFCWDMPYYMNPSDNSKFICGSNFVYKMDGAPYGTWQQISPDLTDGPVLDPRFNVITCVGWSALNLQYMYAGTCDGNVWYTNDGGTNWNDVSSLLPDRYVTSIHASPNLAANVYVTHSGYKYNDFIPHVHKSTDNGQTWTDISGDLPSAAVNDIFILPGHEEILFVGTDGGVYWTNNSGINWNRVGANMPVIPVYDVELNASVNKLVAGTFARGIWSIDLSEVTGVSNMNEENSVMVFPNPSSNSIQLKGLNNNFSLWKIYNLQGEIIQNGTLTGSLNEKIGISTLEPGIYFIEISTNENKQLLKFEKL